MGSGQGTFTCTFLTIKQMKDNRLILEEREPKVIREPLASQRWPTSKVVNLIVTHPVRAMQALSQLMMKRFYQRLREKIQTLEEHPKEHQKRKE